MIRKFVSMGFVFLIIIVLILLLMIVLYFKISFNYWSLRKVLHLKPVFLFGNAKDIVFGKIPFAHIFKDLYKVYKKGAGAKYAGYYIFAKPIFVVFDLDLIESILIRDFVHFEDRSFYIDKENDPNSAHLFALKGQEWRSLRNKLRVLFTDNKIKMMFHHIELITDELIGVLKNKANQKKPVAIKSIISSYTLDTIASCIFGTEMHCLKSEKSEFKTMAEELMGKHSDIRTFYFNLCAIAPNLIKFLKIKCYSKKCDMYFSNLVADIIKYRETNGIIRKDFMHIMIQLKNNSNVEEGKRAEVENVSDVDVDSTVKLTVEDINTQFMLFSFAGYDAAASTTSCCLYELAFNQRAQKKLREEILSVLKENDQKITYDAINQMEYLNCCIKETLRLFSPLPNLLRECTKDYKVPNSDLVIEKGTLVFIPITDIQRDPDYFPNPEEFIPERFFSSEARRHKCAWLPYGDGPRICIGIKFGVLQVKMAVIKILKEFQIDLHPTSKYPPELSTKGFLLNVLENKLIDLRPLKPSN